MIGYYIAGTWVIFVAALICWPSAYARIVTRHHHLTQARRDWYQAEEIRLHQHQRFQLRMRYGAVDDSIGTTSYDCYIRHNEAPSYALALFMDSTRAAHGRRHVLDYPAQAAAA